MRVLLKLVLFFPIISGQQLSTPKIKYAPRSYVCYKVSAPIVVDGKVKGGAESQCSYPDCPLIKSEITAEGVEEIVAASVGVRGPGRVLPKPRNH